MTEPIRIVVADDHPLLRAGIRAALTDVTEMIIIGEAADGDRALQLSCDLRPDVLLLDTYMPGVPTPAIISHVRALTPPMHVVVLDTHTDAALARTLIALGAMGYILKDDALDSTTAAIRAVMAGGRWFSTAILAVLLRPPSGVAGAALTPREFEVLSLVATGQRNAEIAETLRISLSTVEFHIGNLLAKLAARSRMEAVSTAHREGLLPADMVLSAEPRAVMAGAA